MTTTLSAQSLDQLFANAHTCYGYHDTLVPVEQLHAIWNQMKFGPTSFNCLPARIIWCVSDAAKEKLAAHAMEANALRIKAAPVTTIIGMDLEFYTHLPTLFPPADVQGLFSGNEELARMTALRNSTLQGAYLMIAARALGLGVGPMSGFNNAGVDEAFFGGTATKSNFIATMGVPDESSILPRLFRPDFDQFNSLA